MAELLGRAKRLHRTVVLSLLALILLGDPLFSQNTWQVPGIKVGDKIPSIAAQDQLGRPQTFQTLRGQNGLLLAFSRSADWCPYCKMILLELQQSKAEFEKKGVRVASITYDSQGILKTFADRRGIEYPMLSDPDSKIIKAFGILNTDAKGFAAGIPHPGIYFISSQGVVEKRFFEEQYFERFTPNDIYADLYGGALAMLAATKSVDAPHVTIKLSQSDAAVGAGSHIKLFVELDPAAHIHLYAPGAEKNGYKVVRVQIDPSSEYHTQQTEYPTGTLMTFRELKETVPVYSKPTVLTEDVVISAAKEFNDSIGEGKNVQINGTLFYQACDDHQCFMPMQQALSWQIHVEPFDRIRSPEALQHK
jgi:peroxiredoxin